MDLEGKGGNTQHSGGDSLYLHEVVIKVTWMIHVKGELSTLSGIMGMPDHCFIHVDNKDGEEEYEGEEEKDEENREKEEKEEEKVEGK